MLRFTQKWPELRARNRQTRKAVAMPERLREALTPSPYQW
jgi:hypothetical protein